MTMHQTFKKLTYSIGLNGAFYDNKMHLSPRCYGRHHVQSKSRTGGLNNGRATFQRPGGSGMKIRSDARLILKIDNRPFFFGALLNLWENLFLPLLDQLWVSLVGAIQGLLATEPQLLQQAPHRRQAQFITLAIKHANYAA